MNETNEQDADGVDWAAVKRAYVETSESLKDVAARHGVTRQKLVAMALHENWPLRRETGLSPRQAKSPKRLSINPERRDSNGARLKKTSLVARMKRLIDREIDDIEKEYEQDGAPADREKAAKRLTVLVRSLDKLTEIQNAGATRKKKGKKDEHGGEALRAELERRLARLAAGSGETGFSEKPDGEGSGLPD